MISSKHTKILAGITAFAALNDERLNLQPLRFKYFAEEIVRIIGGTSKNRPAIVIPRKHLDLFMPHFARLLQKELEREVAVRAKAAEMLKTTNEAREKEIEEDKILDIRMQKVYDKFAQSCPSYEIE